jgi:hypothetical protein
MGYNVYNVKGKGAQGGPFRQKVANRLENRRDIGEHRRFQHRTVWGGQVGAVEPAYRGVQVGVPMT